MKNERCTGCTCCPILRSASNSRGVDWPLTDNVLVIRDTLEGSGHHCVNVWCHLHPDVSMHAGQNGFGIEYPDGSATIKLDPRLSGSLANI